MLAEFNVKNLLGKVPVTPELKQYYERYIQAIAEQAFCFIDTSKVEKIIVPDDFLFDVVEYQRFLGMDNPSVTNNEFGRAFGKMLHDTKSDKYFVFVDADIATFLMDDTVFNACFNNLDEENKKRAETEQKHALNLLAHELAHVEFDTHITLPEVKKDYDSQLESLLYHLFDEYYACRRSAIVSSEYIISYNEKYIIDIEQKVIDEKWDYKTHNMGLDEFCQLFHIHTKQCLIGMVSVLGMLEDKEIEGVLYENCRLSVIVDDFKREFDKMYCDFLDGKELSMPSVLVRRIKHYYDSFGVYISQRPEDMYYDIPNE